MFFGCSNIRQDASLGSNFFFIQTSFENTVVWIIPKISKEGIVSYDILIMYHAKNTKYPKSNHFQKEKTSILKVKLSYFFRKTLVPKT